MQLGKIAKMLCVHKANIMKLGDGLFLKSLLEVCDVIQSIKYYFIIVTRIYWSTVDEQINNLTTECYFVSSQKCILASSLTIDRG
jgi:hypothetical protein